jgi:hypothetical protein
VRKRNKYDNCGVFVLLLSCCAITFQLNRHISVSSCSCERKAVERITYIIMFSLALADYGNLSVLTFHLLPEQFFYHYDWVPWSDHMANRVTLLFWYIALGHYVIMAANRFTAV